MVELTSVVLENEMDLILAYKQSMKLAELVGLKLPAQTTFATAISEVCRNTLQKTTPSVIKLCITASGNAQNCIIALLEDNSNDNTKAKEEGYQYARKLLRHVKTTPTARGLLTELRSELPKNIIIDQAVIDKLAFHLNNDTGLSPCDEIKRKNIQLIELTKKLKESDDRYQRLTDSLPIMIYSVDANGNITYANEWLKTYTGLTKEGINTSGWGEVIHPEDLITYPHNSLPITPGEAINMERRIREKETSMYKWHTGVCIGTANDEGIVTNWNTFMVDINAQKLIEQALIDNKALKAIQDELNEKINQLHNSNEQLERFAYVTSHDLQEPLRKISFYSDFILQKHGLDLPSGANAMFQNLINATIRVKQLIQDILVYSTEHNDPFTQVNLNDIAIDVLEDLKISIEEKSADIVIANLPTIEGNPRQMKQLFENLIANSLKFSKEGVTPKIHVSCKINDDAVILYFTDHGIGFENKYINKLFNVFQRLHSNEAYKGTGIGLAICKKIVDQHKGSITATGNIGEGATFQITLPLKAPPFRS